MMTASFRAGSALFLLTAALFLLSVPAPALAGGGCTVFNANDTDCDGLDDTTVDPCPGAPGVSSPGLSTTLNRCAGPVATCADAAGNCGAIGEAIRYDTFKTPPASTADCNNDTWLGESGTLGNAVATGVAVDPASVSAVFGCTDAATEQMVVDERWFDPLTRSYPVDNGTYVVNILWAEAFNGVCTFNGGLGAGSRQCDVIVEGIVEYPLFDQYLEADLQDDGLNNGTGCSSLVVRSVVATVTDGALDIALDELDPSPGDGNCNLKAIEVLDALTPCVSSVDCDDGNACTDDVCNASNFCENNFNTDPCDDGNVCTAPDTCTLGSCVGTFTTDPCDDGDLCTENDVCALGSCVGTFSDPDNDGLGGACDPCPNQALNECCGPVAVHDIDSLNATFPGPLDIRLNANVSGAACSGAKTDCRGEVWNGDFGYNVAASASTCNLPNGCPVDSAAVFGCDDAATDDIFKCEHWDAAAAPELLYTFDVPDGPYLVNLLFMNSFTGSANPGTRVFDVSLEGAVPPQIDDFDQVVAAGGVCDPNVAPCVTVNRAVRVDVADGALDVEFLHDVIENPAVKGIEVLQCGCQVDGDCDDGNDCTTDTCNAAGVCQNDNVPDTTSCNDGDSCNVGETCTAGVCGGGGPVDCSGTGDQCNADSTCDAGGLEGNCDVPGGPINEGLTCDDGLACNVGETCQNGACTGGGAPDCSGTGDQCNADSTCDANGTEGNCAVPGGPANEGLGCDDGLACNVGETCQSGACTGGGAPDCSGTGDQCNADGTCDAGGSEGNCDVPGGPANEGLGCDDGLACNVGETCQSGACTGGGAPDCSGTAGQCTDDGSCDPGGSEGNCDVPGGPINEGLTCDDGLACNVGETCQSGACTGGGAPDCSGTGDQCNDDGSCDAGGAEGNCDVPGGAINEGLACDDSLLCNVGETCQNGTCTGGGAPDCSSAGDQCNDASCDANGTAEGNCETLTPVIDGTTCDDTSVCTDNDSCTGGVCGGDPIDCNDGNPCTQDICDPGTGCGSTAGPATVCFEAQKAKMQVKTKTGDPTKNQIKWKWLKGDETIHGDFGDPLTTTTYALCVYDQTGGVPSLATSIIVDPPNAFWDDKDPKGWKYKDKSRTVDGVDKVQLKPGANGKSKAQLRAKGVNVPMPTPISGAEHFDADPSVIVQLLNSEGFCWNSEFTAAKKNDFNQYKAKTP